MSRTMRSAQQISFLDDLPSQPSMFDDSGAADEGPDEEARRWPPYVPPSAAYALKVVTGFLEELRAAETRPWTDDQVRSKTVSFGYGSDWHSQEVKDALRAEFREHAARLKFDEVSWFAEHGLGCLIPPL